MNQPVHTEEYRGYKISVFYDDDADQFNPRDNDNLGTLSWWHRRYNFNEDRDGKKLWSEIDPDHEIRETYNGNAPSRDLMDDSGLVFLPVYMYDHSGVAVNTRGFHCPWDSGQLGWIWCTKEQAWLEFREEDKAKLIQLAEARLEAEISEWNDWGTGQVWWYKIEDQDGELLDSCCGFVGDLEDTALANAREVVDNYLDSNLSAGGGI